MADVNDLYRKVDEIREAIQNRTEPDGTCNFNIHEAYVALKFALRCIEDPPD